MANSANVIRHLPGISINPEKTTHFFHTTPSESQKNFFQRRHIEHTDYVCSRGIPHRATVGVAAKSTIASQKKPRASPFGPAQASQHLFPIVYQKVYLSAILKVHRMQNDTVLQALVSCAILGLTLRLTLGLSYQWLFRPGVA